MAHGKLTPLVALGCKQPETRATGWDTDVDDSTVTTTGEFTIDNHIPDITAFTVLSPDVGTGVSSTDRAWFGIAETGTLEFRYGVSDDDFDRATLQKYRLSKVVLEFSIFGKT